MLVPLRPRQRLVHAAHEQRAVGEVGERVAVGLALERALQLAHAPDRLLEAVELERHAGVAGQRLEQAQVGAAEVGRRRRARSPSSITPTSRVSPGTGAIAALSIPRSAR